MVEENTQIDASETPINSYRTKSFLTGGLWRNIVLTVFISMGSMMLLMSIGVPAIFATVFFLLAIYFSIKALSGNATYYLYSWGFRQEISPFWKYKKSISRTFTWDDLSSYQSGIDLNRSHQEYNYLNLNLKRAPKHIQLSDANADMGSFLTFRKDFENLMDNATVNTLDTTLEQKKRKPIKRKADFYATIWAKLLTLFFVFLCVAILTFALYYGPMGASSWFKLSVIIIPGTIYMVWRVFYMKGK
jgi:hypothetical protein